jgi:hypothetical protein
MAQFVSAEERTPLFWMKLSQKHWELYSRPAMDMPNPEQVAMHASIVFVVESGCLFARIRP